MAPILATDVLVIGGGMAGGIAALAARKSGAEVVVARKAFGATVHFPCSLG